MSSFVVIGELLVVNSKWLSSRFFHLPLTTPHSQPITFPYLPCHPCHPCLPFLPYHPCLRPCRGGRHGRPHLSFPSQASRQRAIPWSATERQRWHHFAK